MEHLSRPRLPTLPPFNHPRFRFNALLRLHRLPSRQDRIFATPLAVGTLHEASRPQRKTVRHNLNDRPLPPLEIVPQKRGQGGNLPRSKLQRVVPGQEHAEGTRSAGLRDLARVFSPRYLPVRDTMIRKSRPGYRTPKSAMQSRYLGDNSIVRPEFANDENGQDSPGNIEPHTPLWSENPESARLSLHGARTEPPRLRGANPGPRRLFRNRSHVSDGQPSSDIAIPNAIASPLTSPRGPPLLNPAPPSAWALGLPLRPSSEARSDASGSMFQQTQLARLPTEEMYDAGRTQQRLLLHDTLVEELLQSSPPPRSPTPSLPSLSDWSDVAPRGLRQPPARSQRATSMSSNIVVATRREHSPIVEEEEDPADNESQSEASLGDVMASIEGDEEDEDSIEAPRRQR
ncbi:unnamed protein product [Zymoseptoria tritici ST99CH_3D7]|uniref:Uncharacterized protein n=1 Tax=Zymoseptoria tritici (strain ST99CH_3D7) TaxID=1276538 RepID=A0A1X7RQC2_ZYMT9|nr:unnamed protein product [Zymoseptoria tritici ST99CH_3D7]